MIETETRPAPQVMINWERIEEACAARGAHTETARAELLGVHRSVLYRWRSGDMRMSVQALAEMAAKVDLTLQEVVFSAIARPGPGPIPPPPPQPPRPAGPWTPPPPPGPKS